MIVDLRIKKPYRIKFNEDWFVIYIPKKQLALFFKRRYLRPDDLPSDNIKAYREHESDTYSCEDFNDLISLSDKKLLEPIRLIVYSGGEFKKILESLGKINNLIIHNELPF